MESARFRRTSCQIWNPICLRCRHRPHRLHRLRQPLRPIRSAVEILPGKVRPSGHSRLRRSCRGFGGTFPPDLTHPLPTHRHHRRGLHRQPSHPVRSTPRLRRQALQGCRPQPHPLPGRINCRGRRSRTPAGRRSPSHRSCRGLPTPFLQHRRPHRLRRPRHRRSPLRLMPRNFRRPPQPVRRFRRP